LKEGFEGKTTEKEILGWSKNNIAAYKRSKFAEFGKELPKTSAGKILRRVIALKEAKRVRIEGKGQEIKRDTDLVVERY
jgi:acyl-coenzyme A synthetase/AMP-(fatty) acid ligase